MINKLILIIIGTIFVVLGTLGIFLPLLPTTPFLLLAAACYLKSSEKFYNWLLNHKLLGKFITNYLKYKAISIRSKVVSIILLWLTIGYSILFVISHFYIKIILLIVAIGVSIHLLLLKTLK
jgi:uncharacterized protein